MALAQASNTGNTPSARRAGLKPIGLNPPLGGGGVENTTFSDKSFYHMFGKHVNFRGSSVLRHRDIRLLILIFLRTVILYIFKSGIF